MLPFFDGGMDGTKGYLAPVRKILASIKRSLEGTCDLAKARYTPWCGCALRLANDSNRPFPARQRLSEQALICNFHGLQGGVWCRINGPKLNDIDPQHSTPSVSIESNAGPMKCWMSAHQCWLAAKSQRARTKRNWSPKHDEMNEAEPAWLRTRLGSSGPYKGRLDDQYWD